MVKPERVLKIARDAGCILVGLGGVVHQTVAVKPGQASALLLGVYIALLSGPAGLALWTQRGGTPSTNEPSSSSPEPASPPPASPPPSQQQ